MACFGEEGRAGAGSSNLARGFEDARAITACLGDGGGSNTAAGHRRWILNRGSSLFGAGFTDGYQALRRDLGKVVRLRLVPDDPGCMRSVAWSNRIRVRARP